MTEDNPLIVPVQTSWTEGEAAAVDKIRAELGGTSIVKKAGIYRAMLRYTLAHRTEFVAWLRAAEPQPPEQIEGHR